jgi:hypothetical protein
MLARCTRHWGCVILRRRFPFPGSRDDAGDRRAANRAVAASAIGLGATGLAELLLAVLTGSVGLL